MWHKSFDKIFLINLPERTDRFEQAKIELTQHNIPFYNSLWPAYKMDNGTEGLWMTMKGIFEFSQIHGHDNILVFEDDVKFEVPNINVHMDECLHDLEKVKWDLFYLGANPNAPLILNANYPSIVKCDSILSTHAVCYSKEARELVLSDMKKGIRRVKNTVEPFDQLLERVIQCRGQSYLANSIIATQRPGYSDILKMDVDWAPRIQDNFCKRIKKMNHDKF